MTDIKTSKDKLLFVLHNKYALSSILLYIIPVLILGIIALFYFFYPIPLCSSNCTPTSPEFETYFHTLMYHLFAFVGLILFSSNFLNRKWTQKISKNLFPNDYNIGKYINFDSSEYMCDYCNKENMTHEQLILHNKENHLYEIKRDYF